MSDKSQEKIASEIAYLETYIYENYERTAPTVDKITLCEEIIEKLQGILSENQLELEVESPPTEYVVDKDADTLIKEVNNVLKFYKKLQPRIKAGRGFFRTSSDLALFSTKLIAYILDDVLVTDLTIKRELEDYI